MMRPNNTYKLPKPRLVRASYLIWLVVPLALWGAGAHWGTPHGRWSYSWIDQGKGYDPFAARYYTSCTYIGALGEITVYPVNGRCRWVRFFKAPKTQVDQ